MKTYDTLSEAITDLRLQGYTEDFNLQQNCLECRSGELKLSIDDFHVDNFWRFEDNTDPDDQAILYAISAPKLDLKGVLVNGYGIYSDPITDEMIAKLKVHG
ncbi:MAG TPA: phosphoribosylpyrophosphate synthetase [Bacteroidia bacterium]|nr:phosphoribosylpyrophosphate synthetase [Bacteroidia bacterium]